jgi:hypothetical protein
MFKVFMHSSEGSIHEFRQALETLFFGFETDFLLNDFLLGCFVACPHHDLVDQAARQLSEFFIKGKDTLQCIFDPRIESGSFSFRPCVNDFPDFQCFTGCNGDRVKNVERLARLPRTVRSLLSSEQSHARQCASQTRRSPSSVRFGSTAVISGIFFAINVA